MCAWTLFLQQLERVGPAGASDAWNAPQDTERFDRARGFNGAHVSDVMANCSRMVRTSAFAASSLPQMNIVGFSPLKSGSTMNALPMQLNALTKRAERDVRNGSQLPTARQFMVG